MILIFENLIYFVQGYFVQGCSSFLHKDVCSENLSWKYRYFDFNVCRFVFRLSAEDTGEIFVLLICLHIKISQMVLLVSHMLEVPNLLDWEEYARSVC